MKHIAFLIPLVLSCSSGPLGTRALDGSLPGGGTTGSGGAMPSGGVTGRGSGGSTSVLADSGSSPDGKSATRVPTNHRPTMTFCPQGRGPAVSSSSTTCNCSQCPCLQDSDCTSGMNGRCTSGPFACSMGCSYDECLSDADCTGNVPCACRSSGSDSMLNFCATQSKCRIDADCGPDGYCSPSLLDLVQNNGYSVCDGLATGYFCHTPNDRCTDDSDCNQGTCNFDLTSQSWSCGPCYPPL